MDTISRKWAQFTTKLQYEDLPKNVVDEVKRFLFDTIGCALGGYKVEDAEIFIEVLKESGGTPEATVIGSGDKTSAFNATLANSLMVRAMDYNDIYWKEDPSHPSDIIPAALSPGEVQKSTGKEIITAIVLAYEFEQRLCEFAKPGIRERKWHHATLTQFVSPLVAGRIYGLSENQIVNAIGISACHNFTPGVVAAGHLTMMKNTVDPLAVQSGVLAAQLAAKGYVGPEAIFEGKEGFVDTFGGEFDLDILVDGLGNSYRILECSMKAFPVEALSHAPISATLSLMRDNQLQHSDVEKVIVKVTHRAKDILADPTKYNPTSKETADHSLPYVISAAVVSGKITPEEFSKAKIMDPDIRAMLPKIEVVADEKIESVFPRLKAADVEIQLKNGKSFTKWIDYPKGDYRAPMSEEELLTKFHSLADPVMTRNCQEKIGEMIWNLETVPDIGQLMTNLKSDVAE
ncbi:MmgE/PrpD family protein [candidate division KSB1 bacterium]|nr:MmgE/PrpD family protein [candidate division KSB1 bacterium]